MTLVGAGGGSAPGGPAEPTIEMREATASILVARELLGIVKDSLQIVFTQLGGNVWKYQSDSGHPVLDAPLHNLRMAIDQLTLPDEALQAVFDQLVDQLPPLLQTQLRQDMEKPIGERNGSLVALETVLFAAAAFSTILQNSQTPVNPSTPAFLQQQLGIALMQMAVLFIVDVGSELTALTQSDDALLLNNPYQEQLNSLSSALGGLITAMTTPELAETIPERLADLHSAVKSFSHLPPEAGGNCLGAMLSAVDLLCTLQDPSLKSPIIIFGALLSLLGMQEGGSSPLGTLDALIGPLSAAIAPMMFGEEASPGQQNALLALLSIVIGGAAIFGAIVADLQPPSGLQKQERAPFQEGVVSFATILLAESGLIESLVDSSLKSIGGENAASIAAVAELATTVALLVVVFTAGESPDQQAALLGELVAPLLAGCAAATTLTAGKASAPVEGALTAAMLALERGTVDLLLMALSTLIELSGSSDEEVKQSLKQIKQEVKELKEWMKAAGEEGKSYQTQVMQPA